MNTLISYPHFITGQLLRSSDLNDIVNYLNEQDRLTRRMLVGAGIFCGLGVSWVENELVVGNGAGVTTKGHLIFFDKNVVYKTCQETSLNKVNDLCLGTAGTIGALELFADNSKGRPIADEDLGDRCVALVYESTEQEDQKGECHQTFVEVTKKKEIKVRAFLIDQKVLTKELPKVPGCKCIDFKGLPQPFIRRPVLENISSAEGLQVAFKQVCENAVASLETALNGLWERTGQCFDAANPFVKFGMVVKERLAAISNNYPERLPLFYNYLKDLIAAFTELASIGEVSKPVEGCIDVGWFPCHLVLGKANGGKCECRTQLYCAPGCHNEGKRAYGKAEFLYNRLVKMVSDDGFIGLPGEIKITPSRSLDNPLSDRAIPFYYKNNGMRDAWNFGLKNLGSTQAIPSYHPPDGAAAPYDSPLSYDLGAWGFFRVEGHLGQAVGNALKTITEKRREAGVPFDVVCVPIGQETPGHSGETCYPDLEEAFHQARSEWVLELDAQKDDQEIAALVKLLETMANKCVHQINVDELENSLPEKRKSRDHCRLEFFRALQATASERKEPFAEYVENHPGLEHQGGVPPGGTLVLVYDGLTTERALAEPTVIADFCLPYLCCKPKKTAINPSIYLCGLPDKACQNGGAVPVFTYPEGGSLTAWTDSGRLVNVLEIDEETRNWNFLPSQLTEGDFSGNDTLKVLLQFQHGKQKETKVCEVVRVPVDFTVKLSPQKTTSGALEYMLFVSGIRPDDGEKYQWGLVVEGARGKEILKESKEGKEAVKDWFFSIGDQIPVKGSLELRVSKGECEGKLVRPLDFNFKNNGSDGEDDTPPDDGDDDPPTPVIEGDLSRANPISRSADKPKSRVRPAKKSNQPADGDTGGRPASDSFQQADVQSLLNQRTEQNKERLELLRDKLAKPHYMRVKMYLALPPNPATTDLRFEEFSTAVLDNWEDMAGQQQLVYVQLLEILSHNYFDKKSILEGSQFDPKALPVLQKMKTYGIDPGIILNKWEKLEFEVGLSDTNLPQASE